MLPAEVEKYLRKYSFGNYSLETGSDNLYHMIFVIPVLEEFEGIKKLLESLSKNEESYLLKSLFVFVVNNVSGVEERILDDNAKTLAYLKSILDANPSDKLSAELVDKKIKIGFVDASTPGNELPQKDGGVGLARKIGMDLALRKFDYSVSKRNLLVCLDGDCLVADNYLEQLWKTFNDENIKSGYVKYEHVIPEDTEYKPAIICYEIFLRYYVLGLNYAKSPYAFHTIGSTLFCDAESYIKVQGMNKRKAAEDFYFIEKLSKLNKIYEISDTRIYPSYRDSWRVPFGTGQRVGRFISKERDEYKLYSFRSFFILKNWLELFSKGNHNADYFLSEAEKISPVLADFLAEQNFKASWNKILNETKNDGQISKQKFFWFDGFKTLKLIHYLRDNLYPDEPMFDVLDEAFRQSNIRKIERDISLYIPSEDIQLKYLKTLRKFY